jgi:hypothetical protein
MQRWPIAHRALVMLLLAAPVAYAADQQILGRWLLVGETTSYGGRRVIIVQGKESPTTVTLTGNVSLLGATLQVIANGGADSVQTFSLPAAGWRTQASGLLYRGQTADDPVRRVIVRQSGGGAVLQATIKAASGIQVVPPNPGEDGGLVLELGGGDRYCVSLGGAAGGTAKRNDAARWKVVGATVEPGCPSSQLPTTTTSSTTSTTTVIVEDFCGASHPACDGPCGVAGYHCESVGSTCACLTGGSDACTICDPACSGGDVCVGSVETILPYQVRCDCVPPPACAGTTCGGNCPAGGVCLELTPGTGSCGCYAP